MTFLERGGNPESSGDAALELKVGQRIIQSAAFAHSKHDIAPKG